MSLIVWWFVLPIPGFDVPYSTVVLDRNDELMGMVIADDGQYRFPGGEVELPQKYVRAVVCFEDKHFFYHSGVDLSAIVRAVWLNIKSRRVVSGGSTITMQVVRLSRANPPRTFFEKFLEICLARRLEQNLSKMEILNLYASHAPMGGNIVGVEAASLKYFNHSPEDLSWAEAALLAVLPNAPSLIFPGKNMPMLKEKRDKLLRALYKEGELEEEDLMPAIAEPLPEQIFQPTLIAPHLLAKAYGTKRGNICRTTIDGRLQKQVISIVGRHIETLRHNHIYNAAVMVAHVPSGEVLAYVGNVTKLKEDGGEQVDIIMSRRSSGSILKPALYALMQKSGDILPKTVVTDVPSRFGNYVPVNFNKEFRGVVPADEALAASLNVPFVRLLRSYGIDRFYNDLKKMGITTLDRSPDNYGLSLILGGAECTLWDICNMYGGMASILRHYNECDGLQFDNEFRRLHFWRGERGDSMAVKQGVLDAGSVWLTLNALRHVERPEIESGWRNFASSVNLSWKTGTSFGFRDAWAVGVNSEYVIGVWVGNADGEGRPGIVGVRAAAPILFEVAALLPNGGEFYPPEEELEDMVICRKSGYRASSICPERDTIKVTHAGERTSLCPYHRLIYLDRSGRYRVTSDVEHVHNMIITPWFVLSPLQEWFYSRSHVDYKKMPPYRADCKQSEDEVMEMIYPQRGVRLFIPRDLGGEQRGVVLEMAHREPSKTVYWHINNSYIGATCNNHQMKVTLTPGLYTLYLVDVDGNTLTQHFRVVRGDENQISRENVL